MIKAEAFTPKDPEFYTEERCFIKQLWGSGRDGDLSVARARVKPGITTAWHRLAVDERYLIESGRGLVEVGQLAPGDVGPGDVVMIPAGARQRITNVGADDLIFLCLCTPAFTAERYEHLE